MKSAADFWKTADFGERCSRPVGPYHTICGKPATRAQDTKIAREIVRLTLCEDCWNIRPKRGS